MAGDGLIAKERYTSRAFLDLEMERLWPRVWQIACREEELGAVGDYVEYTIGDQSILVVRTAPGDLRAFFNACLHRGTRLLEGHGRVRTEGIRCPYHGWCYALDGRLCDVVDRHEFPDLPADLRLGAVRVDTWGGFVFVNLDPDAEPLLRFLDPLPELLAPYRLHEMRFRSYLTTILPANWKTAIDAFNEGYHVQGTHPQTLPWVDDTSLAYEQFRTHAHYGRLASARRQLRPSPRLGLRPEDVDEGQILAALVAGLGGAFLKDERALVEELRAAPPPGKSLLAVYQERRMELMRSRGFDLTGLTPDHMTSADDVYWFPNVVGPIYPGSAILFRVRPNGLDPESTIKDTWVLEWPRPGQPWQMPERRFFPDWTARDWGEITTQDYRNIVRAQLGMKSRSFEGLRLNPRQEGNILHMHRVIDRYLAPS
ncbi:MAG TPA: aromatic ring-hydroxylating dioxygenase subunit alpha [Candidatus Eisenbacteria bacterium]|nr:aromatic ring-hydroxylating dioxygenase subunit alpha [Candidatus Eisenbacteria bacterium]